MLDKNHPSAKLLVGYYDNLTKTSPKDKALLENFAKIIKIIDMRHVDSRKYPITKDQLVDTIKIRKLPWLGQFNLNLFTRNKSNLKNYSRFTQKRQICGFKPIVTDYVIFDIPGYGRIVAVFENKLHYKYWFIKEDELNKPEVVDIFNRIQVAIKKQLSILTSDTEPTVEYTVNLLTNI